MKTNRILTGFAGTFGWLRFNGRTVFNTFLGITPYWEYKPTNAILADSPGVNASKKIIKMSTIDEIHLKCDFIEGSVVNGLRKPIFYGFVLDKHPRFKVFCQPETIQF